MPTLEAIARALGGEIRGGQVLAPTPGHSPRDRGTAIRIAPDAPDGVLVAVFNGGQREALAVKDALRSAGVLLPYGGTRCELSEAERAAIRRAAAEREAAQAKCQREAAEFARTRLAGAHPADPGHSYLTAKRIAPERLWQLGENLIVPMVDDVGALWNLQTIAPDGGKRFLRNGRTKGLFWHAGGATDRLVIGEGMATCAAVRRATGLPVIAALSAANLPDVAVVIRAKRPELELIIAADDDPAGLEAARLASARTGALIALPKEIDHG